VSEWASVVSEEMSERACERLGGEDPTCPVNVDGGGRKE
jgi:hypothetical protein